ncbi:MAG: NifU N-terminal domain-containing protein, partial [Bacteroidetes bacterium]|nr:NifU N-terminal domain-containing protein [Bacteroidota bacterium]
MSTNLMVEIYTEGTPNPESLKFVTDRHILPNFQLDFRTRELAEGSLLAKTLFESPFVHSVFISNNFITITKKPDYDWFEITPELKEEVKKFLQSGQKPVDDALLPKDILESQQSETVATDPISKIKD